MDWLIRVLAALVAENNRVLLMVEGLLKALLPTEDRGTALTHLEVTNILVSIVQLYVSRADEGIRGRFIYICVPPYIR